MVREENERRTNNSHEQIELDAANGKFFKFTNDVIIRGVLYQAGTIVSSKKAAEMVLQDITGSMLLWGGLINAGYVGWLALIDAYYWHKGQSTGKEFAKNTGRNIVEGRLVGGNWRWKALFLGITASSWLPVAAGLGATFSACTTWKLVSWAW